MLLKLKLLTITILSSFVLLLFLCLGSQNLSSKYKLNLIVNKTAELPNGFIVGLSFTLGVISGGLTTALLAEETKSFE